MKQVYSYQEIGYLIDQRKQTAFTCHPEARVTVVQRHPDLETITVTIQLFIANACIAILTNEYPSMVAVLDAFDINDLDEIREVLA